MSEPDAVAIEEVDMVDKTEESSIIKLTTVENSILVEEQNYEFQYTRVKDPEGQKTPYFTVCYREKGSIWSTVNGLLEEKFSIAKTVDIIEEIRKGLNAELIGQKHYRNKTSVKTIFMFKGYTLDIDTYTEVDKILFNLMTTVDIEDLESRTGLAFTITNGFSGNHKLTLNYGFVTTLFGPSPTNPEKNVKLSVTNTFLLDEFSHEIVHNENMQVSYAEVSNVKSQIQDKIQEFKDTPLNVEFIEKMEKLNVGKKFVKEFLNIYDQLTDEYKNMYYASFIWSSFLEYSKDIYKESQLKKYVTAYMAERKLAQLKADEDS
jgi:hypothetical protein